MYTTKATLNVGDQSGRVTVSAEHPKGTDTVHIFQGNLELILTLEDFTDMARVIGLQEPWVISQRGTRKGTRR